MFFLERNSGVLVAAQAFAAHLLFNSGAWRMPGAPGARRGDTRHQ